MDWFFTRNAKASLQADDGLMGKLRPKRSLHRRLAGWMMVVAALPVLVCMLVFTFFIHSQLMEQHSKDGELLAQVLASALTERLADHNWDAEDAEYVEGFSRHPNIAFVCVTRPDGKPLHFGIFRDKLWNVFADSQRGAMAKRKLDIERQDMVDLSHNLVVRTAWVQPAKLRLTGNGPAPNPKTAHGAVVLGLRTEGLGATVASFQIVQAGTVAAVGLACLAALPWLTRRWTGPMRELVAATRRLAQGKPPEPVTLATNDEVGYLAGAFNDMAAKLLAGRRALMEANQKLEDRVKERTQQLQDAVQKLDEMASNDDLTGVANRRAFTNALGRHFDAAVRHQHDLACVMIDLDGFKPINDTLGHQAGDDLLVAVGRVLKSNSRSYDMPARLGGDEFVLLLPRTDEDTARQIIERLFEQFQQEAADLIGDPDMIAKVSMSIGLASLAKSHPDTAEELLHQADQALYAAKESGKAHMRVFDPSLAA